MDIVFLLFISFSFNNQNLSPEESNDFIVLSNKYVFISIIQYVYVYDK